ncbi:MAG: nucleotidyltransferase substrate binding protein [Candidatus Omnitrophica bacterium]|nr:nucleotidyltransferase substrate binding protein [Candidatus Omnitrophota bacterium]
MTHSAQKLQALKIKYAEQLKKAIRHLEYSYNKTKAFQMIAIENDEEVLEAWEGFSSRFALVVDLYTTKYLKSCILLQDPAFEGSYRDILDQAEKLRLIENAGDFMKMREIRNIHSHDYRDDKLQLFLNDLRTYAPLLLKIKV